MLFEKSYPPAVAAQREQIYKMIGETRDRYAQMLITPPNATATEAARIDEMRRSPAVLQYLHERLQYDVAPLVSQLGYLERTAIIRYYLDENEELAADVIPAAEWRDPSAP